MNFLLKILIVIGIRWLFSLKWQTHFTCFWENVRLNTQVWITILCHSFKKKVYFMNQVLSSVHNSNNHTNAFPQKQEVIVFHSVQKCFMCPSHFIAVNIWRLVCELYLALFAELVLLWLQYNLVPLHWFMQKDWQFYPINDFTPYVLLWK